MNIFEKLCRIQNELKAPKSEFNAFAKFNYRNAENILQALKPICLKYETTILLTDSIEVVEGRLFVKTIAELISWDCDGESQGKVLSAVGWAEFPANKRGMDEAQMTGTASSYSKKRSLESLLALSSEKDSDAYDNSKADREAEKELAMQKNQERLDAMENWRIIDGDIVLIKAQDGNFYELSRLTKKQLQTALKNEKFDGIRDFIERELAKK